MTVLSGNRAGLVSRTLSVGLSPKAIVSGSVDTEPLITHRLGLDETAQALLLQRRGEALKAVVVPGGNCNVVRGEGPLPGGDGNVVRGEGPVPGGDGAGPDR